jgi:dTDP-4-amino-4,6-dideoxygalactose transaminase
MIKKPIPFGQPWIGEEEKKAVLEVLEQPVLTHGPQTHAFEKEFAAFTGGGFAVATSSCMGALHLACWELGFGPGDDVIVPAQTHTATVHAVELMGARPVFVDCDPRTGNMTAEAIRGALTPSTKGIVLVHFLGIPCEMDGILAVAEEYGLKVLEDCALAIGSTWNDTHVGLIGDAGAFSFYPAKHITTGEGGMLLTRHRELAESAVKRRGFGVDRTIAERKVPGVYDVTMLGLNYRMSEISAAVGRCQITRIPEILARRKRNALALISQLERLEGSSVLASFLPNAKETHYCLSLVLPKSLQEKRSAIILRLKEMEVGTSVYYPQPVPRMAYYRGKYGYDAARYPEAEIISDGSIALPVGPHLDEADMDRIVEELLAACRAV